MSGDAPAWLADFQARFGQTLRTPLDRASGTLTAVPSAYDAELANEARGGPTANGHEQLAVYNRQYWFRLFSVMQGAFPLTSRLLGYWSFNGLAADYLRQSPPRGWDIEAAADGFEAFVESSLVGDASSRHLALVEAARIDAAYREVFRAPAVPSFRPSAADAARLLDARLTPSPALRLVEEHRPLIELRRKLSQSSGESAVELPPPLAHAQAWALLRKAEGTRHIALAPREADLLHLLREMPVGEALAHLEARCSVDERAALPAQVRGWLGRSVELDLWVGMTAEP